MAKPPQAEQHSLFQRSDHDDLIVVNGRCHLRTQDGHRVISISGARIPLFHYAVGDHVAEAHAMVSLFELGWAEQREVARAFGCTERTVRRDQRRFEDGGLAALGRKGGYPKGRARVPDSRMQRILRLKRAGQSTREIARTLGIDEKAVRKQLRRVGWVERPTVQLQLGLGAAADPNLSGSAVSPPAEPPPAACASADPNLSAEAVEDLPWSLDADPANRVLDRFLAFLGLLGDAAPLFRSGQAIPRAGVLLAIPALIDSGIFEIARSTYGSIGPAFYGLRTTLTTLLLTALLRIKRPEAFKEHSPPDLGRLLGLDRAPEVKTVRRKLRALARFSRAASFGRALAERRASRLGRALGFLYVDGHVRVYHGERDLPKAHVTRMRLAFPATTDYWVNDARGDPLFVITAQANAGMVRMLPKVLGEIRRLVGKRRLTVVFDRGGWSFKLFRDILDAKFDLLTYRKAPFRRVRLKHFERHTATIAGRRVEYYLADQSIRLKGGLRLRQVTRLSQGGHQTPILTSRRDLSAMAIAFRMFERWRQENFFKYLREEFALDALVDYDVEPDDASREIPNPARKAINERLREATTEMNRLKAEYGFDAAMKMKDLQAFARRNKSRPTGCSKRSARSSSSRTSGRKSPCAFRSARSRRR